MVKYSFTCAGAQNQVVTCSRWRYGLGPSGRSNSLLSVRANCFSPSPYFTPPARAIKLGDVVSGFVEPTTGGAAISQASDRPDHSENTLPSIFR